MEIREAMKICRELADDIKNFADNYDEEMQAEAIDTVLKVLVQERISCTQLSCAKCYRQGDGPDGRACEHFADKVDRIAEMIREAERPLRVYICSPFRGDYDANTKNARFYSRHAALQLGVIPIVPHLLFPQFLDDTVPEERALGLRFGLELLKLCDELWVYGDRISEGMKAEIEFAKELGIPVRNGEKVTRVDGRLEEVDNDRCLLRRGCLYI